LPKEGGRFDLAIAIGIIAASNQLTGNQLEGIELVIYTKHNPQQNK
jgi:magnesium chelatase family protein